MDYFLFLDDIRSFNQVKFPIPTPNNVKTARNYMEFCSILDRDGTPSVVSFDFDLTDEHYIKFNDTQKGHNPYLFKDKCGLHCADYLIKYVQEKRTAFPVFFCHSANPIGKKLILDKLKNVKLQIK